MFISKRCNCLSKLVGCCKKSQISKLGKDLEMISVKSRLEILFLLKQKSHCVCDIISHTSMSQSLISHHLSDLAKSGLIANKRDGKFIDYFLTKKGEKVINAVQLIIK